jgi:hypothetical protein
MEGKGVWFKLRGFPASDMVAIFATLTVNFAVANGNGAMHKGRAFQASSPKT